MAIFNFARRARKLCYYGDVIHSYYRKSAVEHDGGVYNSWKCTHRKIFARL